MSNSQKGKEGPKGVHSLGAGSLEHTIWQKQRNKISPAAHNLFLYSKNIKFCCLILKKKTLNFISWSWKKSNAILLPTSSEVWLVNSAMFLSLSHSCVSSIYWTMPIAVEISNTQQELEVIFSDSGLADYIPDDSWVLSFKSIRQVRSRLKVPFLAINCLIFKRCHLIKKAWKTLMTFSKTFMKGLSTSFSPD